MSINTKTEFLERNPVFALCNKLVFSLWFEYLKKINKERQELEKDWTPQAVKRVKSALAIRQIAEKEEIKIAQEKRALEEEKAKAAEEAAKLAATGGEVKAEAVAGEEGETRGRGPGRGPSSVSRASTPGHIKRQ